MMRAETTVSIRTNLGGNLPGTSLMKTNLTTIAAAALLILSSTADADEADAAWTKAANEACTKAAGKTAKVVPDWTVVEVERCDRVQCDAGGSKLTVTLPDGSPCIRYLIVTPPPKHTRGKCSKAMCRT